ncbi:hypothetical protein [Advenella kashmirensis]|uniref:hypothetical protein n=1 Tax=Advenella kashmirensis TaxID=310575 RepID=UPI0012DC06F3|nr:hypothetical protein [Advenella kashmirensis]
MKKTKKKIDYSKGCFTVIDAHGIKIGEINNSDYVFDAEMNTIYRLDGENVYEPGVPKPYRLLAKIDTAGIAKLPGSLGPLFIIKSQK